MLIMLTSEAASPTDLSPASIAKCTDVLNGRPIFLPLRSLSELMPASLRTARHSLSVMYFSTYTIDILIPWPKPTTIGDEPTLQTSMLLPAIAASTCGPPPTVTKSVLTFAPNAFANAPVAFPNVCGFAEPKCPRTAVACCAAALRGASNAPPANVARPTLRNSFSVSRRENEVLIFTLPYGDLKNVPVTSIRRSDHCRGPALASHFRHGVAQVA